MIKRNICTVIILLCLVSCTTTFESQSSGVLNESGPIISLNRQIEQWNAKNEHTFKGVFPIAQRVVRVVYNPLLGKVTCFDKDGEAFLYLKRKGKNIFKGTLQVEYNTGLIETETELYEEEGIIYAEFYLEKK